MALFDCVNEDDSNEDAETIEAVSAEDAASRCIENRVGRGDYMDDGDSARCSVKPHGAHDACYVEYVVTASVGVDYTARKATE